MRVDHGGYDDVDLSNRYVASPRPYAGLPELSYPLRDKQYLVTACGRICMHRKKRFFAVWSG